MRPCRRPYPYGYVTARVRKTGDALDTTESRAQETPRIGRAASPRVPKVDLSPLGAPTGSMVRVHGGFANRLYRLDTDQGSFAVKEMSLADRRSTYDAEGVLRFERAAFAAGIPMPEPILASQHTLVHRWVDAAPVPEAPVSPAFGREIGEILARIHALDVGWTPVSSEDPDATGLARARRARGGDRATVGRRARVRGRDVPRDRRLRRDLRTTRTRRADSSGHPPVEPARSGGSAGGARLGALGDARPGR